MKSPLRQGTAPFAVLALVALLAFPSCNKKNPLEVDVSGIRVAPEFHHFEEALASIPDTLFFKQFPSIYPEFAPLFMMRECDSLIMTEMLLFRSDPRFQELYQRKREILGDMDEEKSAVVEVLRHYHYYYPGAPGHRIYTHLSGLDISQVESPVILNDTLAIVNTDFFLGADFGPYSLIGIPGYKSRWMEPQQLAPEFARQLALLRSGPAEDAETLLDQMIFHGKVLWFMDAMMPETPDSVKIRYTAAQLDWLTKNQKSVWAYLVNNRMLYASDQNHSKLLIMDSPFTSVFTEASPGRIGHWLGWQIVRKYMEKHPGITLPALMEERDGLKILTDSGYKPR